MNQIIDEISLNSKKVILNKKSFFNEKQVSNTIPLENVSTDLDQLKTFAKIIPVDYLKSFDTVDEKNQFLNKVYLNVYKNLITLFFDSQKNSVFLKTKNELEIGYDGSVILENLDFFQVLDIQQLKEDTLNTINNNPCIAMNTSIPTSVQPIQMEIIKTNLRLACRTHILDFKLRKINLTSVFDNTEYYKLDNTLSNYLFDTFVDRLKTNTPSFYQSLIPISDEIITGMLENGEEIVDSITNTIQNLESTDREQSFLIYLKALFNHEFTIVSDNLNSLFKIILSKNNKKLTLSNLYKCEDYFIKNLQVVGKNQVRNVNDYNFFYLVDIENQANESLVTLKLCIKSGLTAYEKDIIELVSSNKTTIAVQNATVQDVPQELIEAAKLQIKNKSDFQTLINYVYPLQKILNFSAISVILMNSNYYSNSNTSFDGSIKTIANIHMAAMDNGDSNQCEEKENPNSSFGFELEIAKIIAQTPIQIIKSIEETYDPNIAIASKLKQAAELVGAPDLSIIPYSSLLMVPPPFGPAIPLIPPLGFIYWGISAAETVVNTAKGNNSVGFDFDFSVSGPQKKDPFKSDC